MQVRVNVDGYGTFQIENDKIGELISWLTLNNAVRVQNQPVKEIVNNQYTGRELLNG